MRRVGSTILLVALLSLPGSWACGRNDEPVADIQLDGTPRVPDVAGVVERVSLKEITVDNKTLRLSRNLQAFSTYTLAAMPVLETKDSYVHVGVKNGKAVWIAMVAKLLRGPGKEQAFYNGTFARAKGRQLVFFDGTVLTAGPNVVAPKPSTLVLAELDPRRDIVVSVSDA